MVILAIGQRPDLSYADSSINIERSVIKVDSQTQATSMANVFAGGDATISGPLSVVAAIGTGRRAAEAINKSLGGNISLNEAQPAEHLVRSNDNLQKKLSRVPTPTLSQSELSLDKEDMLTLDAKSVKTEADRCLNCGCDGVNPSDIAPALVALDAKIVTTRRTIHADDFWVADRGPKPTVLDNDEIIIEIQIPAPAAGVKSTFEKFALRKSIDFPIVNCAAAVESEEGTVKSARICLNGVYNIPYRATKAEESMIGKQVEEVNAEAAGAAVVSDAVALPYNKYKIQIAKAMVKRSILGCQ